MRNVLQKFSQNSVYTLSIVLAFVLYMCVNLIALLGFSGIRLDLTEDHIYTVSPSTVAVLDAVSQPITLRLYLSSSLIAEAPELRTYADHVTELLRTYEQISGGMVRIERIDPLPFSAQEDRAIAYNLVGFNINRAGEQGYFGLVGSNSVDQVEVLEALNPGQEVFLEYDLTRMVLRLSRPTEPRVAVFDGLGMFGSVMMGRPPAALIERLAADFELVQLSQSATSIPEDVDALMVVHPHSLGDTARYLIDQFVLKGGPAAVFLDALAEHSAPSPGNLNEPEFPDSNLEPLMAAWGVTMLPGKVVGDINMALEVRGAAGNRVVISDYPPWLIVDKNHLNADDIATSQLGLMRISTAGPLQPIAGSGTTMTPLITTSADTMLYEQSEVIRRSDPREFVNSFKPSGTVYALAARIEGPALTAFPDGPPPPVGDAAPIDPGGHVARSTAPINVTVVSDTDLLADDLNVNASGISVTQNADFLLNVLDSSMGGGQLIGLRGRGLTYRPFVRVDEIEAAADARFRETEQQLQRELEETQKQLDDMRVQAMNSGGQIGALTREQQDTVARFNQRLVEVRKELREVRGALHEEIDALTNQLRLANIVAIPALVLLIGALVVIWRRMRLSRYLRARRFAASV